MRVTLGGINRAFFGLGAFWAFALALHILVSVAARAIGQGLPGTVEIARESIICIVFLQLGWCVQSNGMLRVDMLADRFGPAATRLLAILAAALGAGFFVLIAVGSLDPAVEAWRRNETEGDGAFRVVTWPARFAIVAGAFLGALAYLVHLADALRNDGSMSLHPDGSARD